MRYFLLHRSFYRPVHCVEVRNSFYQKLSFCTRNVLYIQKMSVFRLNIVVESEIDATLIIFALLHTNDLQNVSYYTLCIINLQL